MDTYSSIPMSSGAVSVNIVQRSSSGVSCTRVSSSGISAADILSSDMTVSEDMVSSEAPISSEDTVSSEAVAVSTDMLLYSSESSAGSPLEQPTRIAAVNTTVA